jgi:2-phosphoglycerate kinase
MIASQDEGELRARFVGRASGQSRRPADRYLENLDGILEIQRHLVAVAHEQGVPVIDNRRFDDSVREVLDHVMEHLARDARVEASQAGLARAEGGRSER